MDGNLTLSDSLTWLLDARTYFSSLIWIVGIREVVRGAKNDFSCFQCVVDGLSVPAEAAVHHSVR